MTEIYYVEDDITIGCAVKTYLEQRNCTVSVFLTIGDAKKALKEHVPHLVLVDWNMPDGQGDMVCRFIRTQWRELPLIFLTVRGDSRDIVSGFINGADDYVVKPFELEVLYARICALLRRMGTVSEQYLSCGSISLDQNRRMVSLHGVEVDLSPFEYRLLLTLMQNKGKIMTRELLLEQIWDSNGSYVNDNTLTVTMKRLREKLHQPSCIKTVRSVGYRLEEV